MSAAVARPVTGSARFALLTGPTPLQRLGALERECGLGPLWVKRDDLTGFATAGNKARPLEHLIAEALLQRADVVVSGGRAGSNFCPALAAAAAKAGLDAELVMGGPDALSGTNVTLSRAVGGRVHSVPEDADLDGADLDGAIAAHAASLSAAGRRVFVVPRGGSSAIGAVGYAEAAHELAAQWADQADRSSTGPLTVVVAVGTGGTVAGLLTGRAELGASWSLAGVCVSTPASEMAARITRIAAGCAALRGVRPGSGLTLTDADGGHGTLTPAQEELADLALRHEGLLLDPTYTAKAFERAVELARDSARPTVFWHTGGIVGALARIEKGTSA